MEAGFEFNEGVSALRPLCSWNLPGMLRMQRAAVTGTTSMAPACVWSLHVAAVAAAASVAAAALAAVAEAATAARHLHLAAG